jgi:hypothetical protein
MKYKCKTIAGIVLCMSIVNAANDLNTFRRSDAEITKIEETVAREKAMKKKGKNNINKKDKRPKRDKNQKEHR